MTGSFPKAYTAGRSCAHRSTVGLAAVLVSSLMLLTLLLAACGSGQSPPPTVGPPETPTSGTAEVVMKNLQFVPQEITITTGTTVVWTNEDSFAHTVTSGPRGNPSGLFDQEVPAGGSFEHTFQEPGTYPYNCKIHPGMDGTVVVQ